MSEIRKRVPGEQGNVPESVSIGSEPLVPGSYTRTDQKRPHSHTNTDEMATIAANPTGQGI